MIKLARTFYRFLRDTFMLILKCILFLIPKDEKLIVFTAWFGQKYADNTKFQYEYLLDNNKYKVMWTTKNREVYSKLKQEGKPVVFTNSLKGLWIQIRAKMLVSTIQVSDYNKFFLSRCIFLDLDHGIIFKQVGLDIDKDPYTEKHDKLIKKFIKYYMTTPSYLTEKMMEHSYHVTESNTILCGKPRLDYFFDKNLRGDLEDINVLKGQKKTIIYMPTHRSCGKIEMNLEKILDLGTIDELCEKNGYIFIIKKHFYHRNEKENLYKYKNIIDITGSDIDAQKLLYSADVLISDYSSAYIDYLLLDRPLILYTFDLDTYLKQERGLFISFNDLNIGYQPKDKDELNQCIEEVMLDVGDRYRINRLNARRIYFDDSLRMGNSREEISSIIDSLLDGSYHSKWQEVRSCEEKRNGVIELVQKIKNME